jgi:hypothetical protein
MSPDGDGHCDSAVTATGYYFFFFFLFFFFFSFPLFSKVGEQCMMHDPGLTYKGCAKAEKEGHKKQWSGKRKDFFFFFFFFALHSGASVGNWDWKLS